MLSAFTIIPLVGQLINSVESLFGGGNGQKKKDAVVAAVQSVFNIAQTVHPNSITSNSPDFIEGLNMVIDGIVKMNNATGVFKK